MSTVATYKTNSSSSGETEALAALLGANLRGGEIFVLVSDLGGGKTAFVRGLAKGMGSSDHVASPTFTISREYTAGKLTLEHFDFYRLNEPGIMSAELSEFLNDPSFVVAIEWGAIVEDVLPPETIAVSLTRTGETDREIVITYAEKFAYIFEGVDKNS